MCATVIYQRGMHGVGGIVHDAEAFLESSSQTHPPESHVRHPGRNQFS